MSATYKLDGALYALMIKSGAVNLRNNAQTVNELNVFPIPDGDTGENMARTMEGGIAALESGDLSSVATVSDKLARGMLLSARGNSGVILSQFFEGLRRGFDKTGIATVSDIKRAFRAAVKQAYSAVVAPTEGTILTVMREATEKADGVSDDATAEEYFELFIDEMYASLERTPDLLAVLKEAGVIDSGGAGFVYVIEGMFAALCGKAHTSAVAERETAAVACPDDKFTADSEMKFGYCTELIVQLTNNKTDVESYDVKTLIEYLEGMGGESIVAFKTDTRIKLHVHTFEPDKVIAYCLTVGELIAVKIENMSVQHTEAVVRNRFERQTPKKERNKYACVAVADGDGLIEQFRSLGATVVDGKQTMNPSTMDFISAFDAVNADVIFVFPNNANVVMAANQAAEMYDKSRVIVINSTTLAQGYSAVSMIDYSSDNAEQIKAALDAAAESVATGLVTYSIRDCRMSGKDIKKGDFMGLADKTLVSCEKNAVEAACRLIDGIDKKDKSVVIVMTGKDGNESDTQKISDYIKRKYPELEFYSFDGGQDVYSYIFVVE